jgi:hypothetical protein
MNYFRREENLLAVNQHMEVKFLGRETWLKKKKNLYLFRQGLTLWPWNLWSSCPTFFLLLFFYSHVHTLFGSFLPPSPLPHHLPPSSLSSRQVLFCFITSFVEEKRQA